MVIILPLLSTNEIKGFLAYLYLFNASYKTRSEVAISNFTEEYVGSHHRDEQESIFFNAVHII